MSFIDEKTYRQTLEILRGQTRLAPLYQSLADFIWDRFSARAVHFRLDLLNNQTPPRPRLQVLLMGGAEAVRSLEFQNGKSDSAPAMAIAKQYRKQSGDYSFELDMDLYGLFVYFTDLEQVIIEEMSRRASPEGIAYLRQHYAQLPIWRLETVFGTLFVFFETCEQVEESLHNGTCDQMRADYAAILRKYDEFDAFSQQEPTVKFDSKETVDTHYQGSMFYYYR